MSKLKSPTALSESILEEATGWFIDFNEGELDADAREQFNRWLRRSPEHVRAYIEIAAAWEDSSRLNPPRSLELDALIAQAAAERSNVVSLKESFPLSRDVSAPQTKALDFARRRKYLPLAAAVLLAVAGFSTWWVAQQDTYSTTLGEQRFIAFSDGSTVNLNSRSRLKVLFTDSERTVELLEGQALFKVKKDTARPFVVDSDGTRVQAIGTEFDVYRKAAGITVTVIEGSVAVLHPSATESRPVLTAGEQLTVTAQSASRSVHVDPAVATAWTQRKLIFDETPLTEAVAEFNRYNSRQIVIDDADLASFHIRGNFQATDPDRLVQFLRDRFGVRAVERGGEIRISGN